MSLQELGYLLTDIDEALIRIDFWKMPGERNTGIDVMFAEMEVEQHLIDAREALQKLIAAANTEYVRQQLPVRVCRCVDTDNSLCGIHTVGHPYRDGCCEQPEDNHRDMTDNEYRAAYPKVFDERVVVGEDTYQVDAHRYTTTIGLTITQLFKSEESNEDGAGVCFDMPIEALRAILPSLQRLARID